MTGTCVLHPSAVRTRTPALMCESAIALTCPVSRVSATTSKAMESTMAPRSPVSMKPNSRLADDEPRQRSGGDADPCDRREDEHGAREPSGEPPDRCEQRGPNTHGRGEVQDEQRADRRDHRIVIHLILLEVSGSREQGRRRSQVPRQAEGPPPPRRSPGGGRRGRLAAVRHVSHRRPRSWRRWPPARPSRHRTGRDLRRSSDPRRCRRRTCRADDRHTSPAPPRPFASSCRSVP
jgi:hypothetical protein